MHSFRRPSTTLWALPVLAASSQSFAQNAPAPIPSQAAFQSTPGSRAPAGDAEAEDDRFCAVHWFAVGKCRDRGPATPDFVFGLDLGVTAMNEHGPFGFNHGVGSVTSGGPAWGVRVGVELVPWLALEAHYVGMYDSAQAPASPGGREGGFLTSGCDAVVRLTLPLAFVHPYVFAGIGYYDVALVGSSGSELHSSSQAGIPMGVGFDVPLTYHLSVGAEATYHYQIQESYSSATLNGIDGGDLSTFIAVLRARL